MKIKLTSVYVNDQEKALRFYTKCWAREEGRLQPRAVRWLDGGLIGGPGRQPSCSWRSTATRRRKPTNRPCSSKASPRPMFFTDDVQADYERMKARGAEFTNAAKGRDGSKIAMLNDTLRQCHSGHTADALAGLKFVGSSLAGPHLTIRRRSMTDRRGSTHRGPAGGAQIRKAKERSGRSFSSENCVTRRKRCGWRLLIRRICANGRRLRQMGAWVPLNGEAHLGRNGHHGGNKGDTSRRSQGLEYTDTRWELEAFGGGTRLSLWHNIDRRFISMGACRMAHLFRCSGSPSQWKPHQPHRRRRGYEVHGWQRLNAEYAKQFGIKAPNWPPQAASEIVKPGFTVCTYQPRV